MYEPLLYIFLHKIVTLANKGKSEFKPKGGLPPSESFQLDNIKSKDGSQYPEASGVISAHTVALRLLNKNGGGGNSSGREWGVPDKKLSSSPLAASGREIPDRCLESSSSAKEKWIKGLKKVKQSRVKTISRSKSSIPFSSACPKQTGSHTTSPTSPLVSSSSTGIWAKGVTNRRTSSPMSPLSSPSSKASWAKGVQERRAIFAANRRHTFNTFNEPRSDESLLQWKRKRMMAYSRANTVVNGTVEIGYHYERRRSSIQVLLVSYTDIWVWCRCFCHT